MRLFQPKSILQLTIIGFMTVTILLVAAVIVTMRQVDGFSYGSRQTVTKVAGAMQSSRKLIEQSTAMDRNIKQYNVLGDKKLLEVYDGRRKEFFESATTLILLAISDDVISYVRTFISIEQEAYEDLIKSKPEEEITAKYSELIDMAYVISGKVDNWINEQQLELRQQAEQTTHLLKVQTFLLVCTALMLAGLFTALITRPLRQVEHAINQLGRGGFDNPIKIRGPLDLQELGTRLEWLRSRLSELEQQRTFFIRHVSHELKTPLTAIQEGVSLLNEGIVGQLLPQQSEIIGILQKNCSKLQTQIESLLRYNAESLSILKPMPHRVKLAEVIRNVLSEHTLTIKTEKLQVNCKLDKLTVIGDKEQLRLIIDNLLTNAIKFSPERGGIDIILKQEQQFARLDIYDQGPGILDNEHEKIFEAFYQGNPPTGKQSVKGTGLGLAIARQYVQMNGGSIDSIHAARGAHFIVRIPLANGVESANTEPR